MKNTNNDLNFDEDVQKALNKLISEEWLAGNTYLLFANAVSRDDKNLVAVRDALFETAIDELQDHMKSLIEFAMKYGYDVPSTLSEFKKYASKEDYKLFESFKKGKPAGYYLALAVESEKRAVESYEKVFDDLDQLPLLGDLQVIINNNYYDEVEHLESFKFLKYTIDAQLDFNSEE